MVPMTMMRVVGAFAGLSVVVRFGVVMMAAGKRRVRSAECYSRQLRPGHSRIAMLRSKEFAIQRRLRTR